MHLATYYDGVELYRRDKAIIARFLEPHVVVSTCRAAGGVQRDLEYVLNHQSCEPKNHHPCVNYRDAQSYRQLICEPLGLPPQKCATMGTAANMHHAAFVQTRFRSLEVIAVVTGGVETNAGRAGDPASVVETESGYQSLHPERERPGAGTINTMIFISKPLIDGALTRVIMTATEAKSAALQELAVNSRYSDQLATGTGTDQIIVAAPERDEYRLTWAGKHSKLGELIGRSVHEAVKKTLSRQNSLEPAGQCSVKIHLERFGCTTSDMKRGIAALLDPQQRELFTDNFHAVNRDPVVVAAAASIAHLRDKFTWNVLPASCLQEIMGGAAAQLACAVSGQYEQMETYRLRLGRAATHADNGALLRLCWQALALGFTDKWPVSEQQKEGGGV